MDSSYQDLPIQRVTGVHPKEVKWVQRKAAHHHLASRLRARGAMDLKPPSLTHIHTHLHGGALIQAQTQYYPFTKKN
jgi:hypothetical protein